MKLKTEFNLRDIVRRVRTYVATSYNPTKTKTEITEFYPAGEVIGVEVDAEEKIKYKVYGYSFSIEEKELTFVYRPKDPDFKWIVRVKKGESDE